jgi:ABC-type multidrug transport system ATPase subunit
MEAQSHSDLPALEVRDLVKKFGDLTAVDHLSLQVNRGEVFGFLGPNGAGKTTAIRIMCGLLRPTRGEVLIDGKAVPVVRNRKTRTKVGICPQENILWNKLSCFEQLVFSARMYSEPSGLDRAEVNLKALGYAVNRMEDRFVIRARNLVSRIQEIYQVLEMEKIHIREMKIRQNTLEDVFIHLTGKSLRT